MKEVNRNTSQNVLLNTLGACEGLYPPPHATLNDLRLGVHPSSSQLWSVCPSGPELVTELHCRQSGVV